MADDLAQVGVVVVTYASAATIDDCLGSLPLDRLGDVVVVDNASPDDTPARVRAHGVRVVEQDNLGFGAGNNRGVAATHPSLPLVLFLNPDAVLATADLERLVAYLAAHPECAVVGPRVLSRGAPSWSAGRTASLATELRPLLPDPLSRLGPRRRLPPSYAVSGPVGYVEGGCFLVRRDDLAAVGGFDEGYFLYFEEVDLSLRAARAGWESWYVPAASIVHEAGASTGASAGRELERRMPRYWFESRRRYFLRNRGLLACLAADLAWTLGNALWNVRRFLARAPRRDPIGFWSDFVRFNLLGLR